MNTAGKNKTGYQHQSINHQQHWKTENSLQCLRQMAEAWLPNVFKAAL